MDAAQKTRTPTDADRERVWAGMLAVTMSGAAGAMSGSSNGHTEHVAMPVLPQSVPAPEPVVIPQISQLETQELVPARKDRRPLLWGAVAFAAMAMGVGGYGINSYLYRGTWQEPQVEMAIGTAQGELVAEPELEEEEATAADEPVAEEPEPSVEPLPTEDTPPADDGSNKARKRRYRAPPRAHHRSNPADEARQLFSAERALKLGESKLALDMLNELERRFPQSRYETERDALRAQILCERGRTKAARKVILELEASNADEPLLAAVDQACTR
jgi:hypothetical protein